MTTPLPTTSTAADMDLQREVCSRFFADPQSLAITYTYNGQACRGMPSNSTVNHRIVDANLIETVFVARVDDNLQEDLVRFKSCCL